MALDYLKKISFELEQNIKSLEEEVRDASKFVYQYGDNSNSKGIEILEDLSKEWKKQCAELEESIKVEEESLDEMIQHLQDNKMYITEIESKETEYKNFLIQQNFLTPDTSHDQQLQIEQDLSGPKKYLKERKFKSPLTTPVDSTFIIPRVQQLMLQQSLDISKENHAEFQNTICDFQTFKETSNNN